MKKELIKTITSRENTSGQEIILEYFLTEEQTAPKNGFGFYSYGIEVVKTCSGVSERKTALSISCDKSEVTELIFRMAKGEVTPLALCDIVCDMFYEKSLNMCKRLCS